MSDSNGADFQARILEKRPMSMRVKLIEESKIQWVPLSCLHDDSELYKGSEVGDVGKLVLKTWFAEKENLL